MAIVVSAASTSAADRASDAGAVPARGSATRGIEHRPIVAATHAVDPIALGGAEVEAIGLPSQLTRRIAAAGKA